MPYRNLFPLDPIYQRMTNVATIMARHFVRKNPTLDVLDFVHACFPLMEDLKTSWRKELGSLENWIARPFAKEMNKIRRGQSPLQVSENRAIRAGRIGKMETELRAMQKKLSQCTIAEIPCLLASALQLNETIDKARLDAAARTSTTPKGQHGEELSLEEFLPTQAEPMHWELRRRWNRIEQEMVRLPTRDAALIREMVMQGVPSRIAGPRHGLTHAGASAAVRRTLMAMQKSLKGRIDTLIEDED